MRAASAATARAVALPELPPSLQGPKPEVSGKFFLQSGEKTLLRGVTYGTFATGSHGDPFPEREQVARDFEAMRQMGANCVRTFTAPPRWLLDLAAENGLWVLGGLAWTQHTFFLQSAATIAANREQVRDSVRPIAGHPALLGYLIGNEIPPDIVRWSGPERVRKFLRVLASDVRELDPTALLSYANFPTTEYLDVDCIDFVCFNVYLHDEASFRRYLTRLQNLAGDKPLVLTEFGIDSIREGADRQASILSWQIRAAFEDGVAGTFVFSWTDEWFTGGADVSDWAFGLVTRDRAPKPAAAAVSALYRGPLPPPLERAPKVSVVICAYNAERTMEACCESLLRLHYQPLEVIVVDDGSTDRTLEIARRYPFKVIHQKNRGLSVARNVGIEAATGEFVAFTDSDCMVDPDWLTYLIGAMLRHGWVAAGGLNLPPPEESKVASCVALAPGGPTHVLLDEDIAEHIPGCNMAFRRSALRAIGGFDPAFTAAGDDVDICWRLQNQGERIGFSPAAMVWHFRRNSLGAYLRQQRGYGKAEALLYFKHPYRFNLLGQARWLGRISGGSSDGFLSHRPVIYHGTFGRGLFQTLYEPPSSLLSYLPFTLEWNAVAILLALCAFVSGRYVLPALVPLATGLVAAASRAAVGKLDPRHDDWKSRILLGILIYLGPLVRAYDRYRWRLRGLADVEPIVLGEPRQPPKGSLALEYRLDYWSEQSADKEALLDGVVRFLRPRKYLIDVDNGWNEWDLKVHQGIWSKADVTVAVENHGGQSRLLRVRCKQGVSGPGRLLLGGCALLMTVGVIFSMLEIALGAIALGAVNLALLCYGNYRLGETLYHVTEIVAAELELVPVERVERGGRA